MQVSLWDARTGLCIQTFYGHLNSCNHVAFNLRGDPPSPYACLLVCVCICM